MRTLLLALLAGCPGPDETDPDAGTDDRPCGEVDDDEDGVNACDDCDDGNAAVYPGAVEACDGLDSDCVDGPHPSELDADGNVVCAACDDAGFWLGTRDAASRADVEAALDEPLDWNFCTYSSTASWMFTRLDNNGGSVACVYTGRTTPVNGTRPDPNTDMNVEHSWPQSQGADEIPMRCDLHHLFPADVDANQARAAFPYGEVTSGNDWSEGGSRLGRSGGTTVFEPRDDHKGDVARAMLYMSYQYDWSLSGSQVALFKAWHAADTPTDAEVERSLDIAEEQNHANPFVVCPELVDVVY